MYIISDIKKVIFNRITIIVMFLLLAIMIIDPISVYWQAAQYPGFFEEIGSNPFQYWLLMNSAGWGNTVFNIVFWALPMFIVCALYYFEQKSSMAMFLMVRKSKISYYTSKFIVAFSSTFIIFASLLLINVLVTYSIFPNQNSFSQQYSFYVPTNGTFAFELYSISPIFMAIIYCLLNAMALAVVSVFYLGIHMLVKFKNQYVAIVVPIVTVYTITFLFDSFIPLWRFNLSLFIQPLASSALTEIITGSDILVTVAIWVLFDVLLLAIGMIKNRDVL